MVHRMPADLPIMGAGAALFNMLRARRSGRNADARPLAQHGFLAERRAVALHDARGSRHRMCRRRRCTIVTTRLGSETDAPSAPRHVPCASATVKPLGNAWPIASSAKLSSPHRRRCRRRESRGRSRACRGFRDARPCGSKARACASIRRRSLKAEHACNDDRAPPRREAQGIGPCALFTRNLARERVAQWTAVRPCRAASAARSSSASGCAPETK